jgi:alanine dehydrogenase
VGADETLILTRGDVRRLLPMPDCIEAVEAAFLAQAAGETLPSAVLGVHLPGGGLHVKAAGLRRGRLYVAVKANVNLPGNPEARGLPTIQGVVGLYDGDDGRPLALMDATLITALRTAAATAVAARHLATPEAATLAVIGCGTQAPHHIRAVAAVRPLRRVLVHDRVAERATRLASEAAVAGRLEVAAVDDVREAVGQADVVVTCTPARAPIVWAGDVRPGTLVAGVGADNPAKQELDPQLLAASRVVVDSIDQASAIGDLHHAIAAGALTAADVYGELWEVVAGRKPGWTSTDEVTVFDSTGVALEDVAAAALVYERALAAGAGDAVRLGALHRG